MNKFTCKACGKALYFIPTPAGRMMPCDTGMHYGSTPGTDTLINRFGEVVKCTVNDTMDRSSADVEGWIPHWATCKNADKMRKSAKPKVKKRRPVPQKQPQNGGQMNLFEMMR